MSKEYTSRNLTYWENGDVVTSFVSIHFNGEAAKLALVTLIVSNGEGHKRPATFPLKGKGSSG